MLKVYDQLLEQIVERLQALPEEEQDRIAANLQKQLDRMALQAEQRRSGQPA